MTEYHAEYCIECGKLLPSYGISPTWFRCSVCGFAACIDCRKQHIPLCISRTWGMATVKDGELVREEKPRVFSLGR